jgi:hypothetical protein
MHPGQANITGASQARGPCSARDRAFAPGAARILRLKRVRGFPLPGRLEGLMVRLGPDGEPPPWRALLGAYTWRDLVAVPTIFGREFNLADGIPAMIHRRRPARTGLAGRTGRVLLVLLDLAVLGITASPCARLPVIVKARGPSSIYTVVVLTLDQPCGVQEAGVHDRGSGQ